MKRVRIAQNKDAEFAHTIAVSVDEQHSKIVALYSDRTLFIWDVKKIEKIGVYRTFLNHSGPIHDIELLSDSSIEITKFATCSADRTIRIWHFYDYTNSS